MDIEGQYDRVCRYCGGYQEFLGSVYGLSSVIPLLAAVCLCGLFSEEKRTRAAEYLPNQLFNVGPSFRNFSLIPIFGTYLNNLEFTFFLYGALAVCLAASCWFCWRWNAVSGK